LPFEKRLLVSLFRQQLIFIHELEELTPNRLQEHMKAVISQEISLFTDGSADDHFTREATLLVDELVNYYKERSSSEDNRSFV
jgi:hypothetical protein